MREEVLERADMIYASAARHDDTLRAKESQRGIAVLVSRFLPKQVRRSPRLDGLQLSALKCVHV